MKRTLAVFGCGGWGGNWLDRALRDPDIETLAFVDTRPDVLEGIAARGVPRDRLFTDAAAALAEVKTDAITCTIPNPWRIPILHAALEQGRHILVDKPLVRTPHELRSLLHAAANRNTVFMVAQNYRFFAGSKTAKEWLAGGELGKIGSVHAHFLRDAPQVGQGFLAPLTGTMALGMEMCIHHFDMVRFFLGTEPSRVSAKGWRNEWSYGAAYIGLDVHLEFPGGVHVAYDANWNARHNLTDWNGHWEIACERGAVSYGRNGRSVDVFVGEDRPVNDAGPNEGDDTAQSNDAVWNEFKAAIDGDGRSGFCPIEENTKSLAIAFAVGESVETGHTVDMSAFIRDHGLETH